VDEVAMKFRLLADHYTDRYLEAGTIVEMPSDFVPGPGVEPYDQEAWNAMVNAGPPKSRNDPEGWTPSTAWNAHRWDHRPVRGPQVYWCAVVRDGVKGWTLGGYFKSEAELKQKEAQGGKI
jgi:hypothetical protein